jgi:hypothetical protein
MAKLSHIAASVALLMVAIGFVSCNEPRIIEMEEVHLFEDKIPTLIPSAATVQTRIERNRDMKLIVGAPKFYEASPAEMQQVAVNAGQLALATFGTGIEKGVLIITKDLKNHVENPADGIITDMKIDSLKAAMKDK